MRAVIAQYFRRGKSLGYRQSRDFSSSRPSANGITDHERELVGCRSGARRERMEQEWKQEQVKLDEYEMWADEKLKNRYT